MIKVMVITGTRPEIIKVSMLIRFLQKSNDFSLIFVHSGQHYDDFLFKNFILDLELPLPDYNLEIRSGSHNIHLSEIISKLEPIITKEKPDIALVEGDTNTVLGTAIACAKLNIGVGHVEAGLRSFDKLMPEEINRIITGNCAILNFAPTERAAINLLFENVDRNTIFIVGNTIVDACLYNVKVAVEKSSILKKINFDQTKYNVLVTLHRPSNVDDKESLKKFAEFLVDEKTVNFIFPIHPRTEKNLRNFSLYDEIKTSEHIKLIEPLGYIDFLCLLKNSNCVITDSGGVQEEATVLNIPCVTVRNNTERPETIEAGCNILVGNDYILLKKVLKKVKNDKTYLHFSLDKHPFGDGHSSERILNIIKEKYEEIKLKFQENAVWTNIPTRRLVYNSEKAFKTKEYETRFNKKVQLIFDKFGNPIFPSNDTVIEKDFSVIIWEY